MRLAWVSPLPPIHSGIADYSAEIVPRLAQDVALTCFAPSPWEAAFLPGIPILPLEDLPAQASHFDLILYHLGNNPHHVGIYDLALRLPGAVVLHDYVLHNLVARCTLLRGDLAGYIWHLAYECGEEGVALALRRHHGVFGENEQFLIPLNRVLLDRSCGVVVHNSWVEERVRRAHPDLIVRRIPHHLADWPLPNPQAARRRLGLQPEEVLLASFGFLSTSKRIDRLLQVYARLLKRQARVRCFLVGEPAPCFDLPTLLSRYGVADRVVVTGYLGLSEFYTLIAACDIAVNLRYPSAGETSGSLVRLLGCGKAVLVSNVDQFALWPEGTCLKVDLGPGEEEMLHEYIWRLIEDESLRRRLGENARRYIQAHHSLERSLEGYRAFLQEVRPSRNYE